MTSLDSLFVKALLKINLLEEPCLELGTGYGGETCKEMILANKLSYFGTDMFASDNVDFVIDFEENYMNTLERIPNLPTFKTILVLNVLEHTYNPALILDNVFGLLGKGGKCVIITPVLWPIHDYPIDCWRILPDFYTEYSKRNGYKLLEEHFEYIGYGPIKKYKTGNQLSFPQPGKGKTLNIYSKLIHKVFNTYGRSMFQPSHVAIGAVITK